MSKKQIEAIKKKYGIPYLDGYILTVNGICQMVKDSSIVECVSYEHDEKKNVFSVYIHFKDHVKMGVFDYFSKVIESRKKNGCCQLSISPTLIVYRVLIKRLFDIDVVLNKVIGGLKDE